MLKRFSTIIFVTFGFTVPVLLSAQNIRPSLVVDRIVAPIDETNLVTLKGNDRTLPPASRDLGPAEQSTPTGRIMLVFRQNADQQQALTQYLADLQNPSSSVFHKWLTPAQYGDAFGISDSDLQTVKSWLEAQGFKIEKIPRARNIIEFSGTLEGVQKAFHTSVHRLSFNDEMHLSAVSDPQVPAALASVIAGVGPLNDFHPKATFVPAPKGHYNSQSKAIEPAFSTGSGNNRFLYVTPADAATIYDSPNRLLNANFSSSTSYDGTGVSIGIAGDSNINMQDIENYRTGFLGETPASANLPTVVADGDEPAMNRDESEALLDNEIAGGLAPGAKVYFYTADSTNFGWGVFNSVFRALDDNKVDLLSISFDVCEPFTGTGTIYNSQILQGMEQAAAQGITVTAGAGDNGSADCDFGYAPNPASHGFSVNALASSPYTVAVGGTDFDVFADDSDAYLSSSNGVPPYYGTATKYIPENPWNNSTRINATYAANLPYVDADGGHNTQAGGGGVSTLYAKPPFQTSLTPNDNARDLPDVSLLAAPGNYGAAWLLCADNQALGASASPSQIDCENTNGVFSASTMFTAVGGTSAAAPAFAGMLALVAQAQNRATHSGSYRLGQANYVLYNLAASKYSTVFHDITVGNNSVYCAAGSPDCGSNQFLTGYNAGNQYDLATGLGSVDVTALVNNWSIASFGDTTTSLRINGSTSPVNIVHGRPLTFSVGTTPTSATGTVAIIDTANETPGGPGSGPQNNAQLVIPLTAGAGSTTYNGLPGGTYSVSAHYSGDASNSQSTSNPIPVQISAEPSKIALTVVAFSGGYNIPLTDIPYGSLVRIDAAIQGAAEGANSQGLATGTATFLNGSNTFYVTKIGDGSIAEYPEFPVLPVGSYNITVQYSGDPSYEPSQTASAVSFNLVKATTSTTASASSTSVTTAGSTGISAVVSAVASYAAAAPTGTIVLSAGGTTLATITSFTSSPQICGRAFCWVVNGGASINGSQLPVGSNTITVTYSGDANYTGSSATVGIDVSVAAHGAVVSPTSLTFDSQATGTTSAAQTVTLTSSGTAALSITSIAASGDFAETNTCGSSVAAGANCSISVTFTPTTSGSRAGTITITDNADGAPQTVTLSGTGSSIAVSGPSTGLTISSAGGSANASIQLSSVDGFSGTASLTCTVAYKGTGTATDLPTCSLNPAQEQVSSGNPATATLTVNTTTSVSSARPENKFRYRDRGAALAALLLICIVPRRRWWRRHLGLLVVLAVIASIASSGCGGSGTSGNTPTNTGTTAGNYSVTVTATSGTLTASTSVPLSVQ